MEKSYETYAKKVLMLKHTHKQEAGKIRDTISQIGASSDTELFKNNRSTICF